MQGFLVPAANTIADVFGVDGTATFAATRLECRCDVQGAIDVGGEAFAIAYCCADGAEDMGRKRSRFLL